MPWHCNIAPPPLQGRDAPALPDAFYLNLVDWSAQNVLAVGLGPCVYLWSAHTSKVWGGNEGTLQWVSAPVCTFGPLTPARYGGE